MSKMAVRGAGAILVTLLFLLALPVTGRVAATPRTEALVRALYAAYNINGPEVVVDGVTFQAGNSPALSAGPFNPPCVVSPAFVPAVSGPLADLLRCFSWGNDQDPGFVKVANVPSGFYDLTVWTWEDNDPTYFDLAVEGTIFTIHDTVANRADVLGPFRVNVVDGEMTIRTTGGSGNIAGIRIDRITSVPDGGGGSTPGANEPDPSWSRYQPVTPARILDTRPDSLTGYAGGKPGSQSVVPVQVTGVAGVLPTATAVVVNITATEAVAAGFVTAYPAGSTRPTVSSLNPSAAGDTVANMAIVPIGANGQISLYTNASTHLVVDVAGFFTTAGLSTVGRYFPVSPQRTFDTRPASAVNATGVKPDAGASQVVQVRGKAGVPATATAVVVSLTATEPEGRGFVTAFPTGIARPTVSNLNVTEAGTTVANLAVVPIGADGSITLFNQTSTHLIVDIQGWFGNGTEPSSTSGYFIPQQPIRTADSRFGVRVGLPLGPFARSATVQPSLGAAPGITPVSAVVFNLTAVGVVGAGFVTAFPAGAGVPLASNLNTNLPGQTVPVFAITSTSVNGNINLFTQTGGDLVVDVSGWFTA